MAGGLGDERINRVGIAQRLGEAAQRGVRVEVADRIEPQEAGLHVQREIAEVHAQQV